MSSVLRRVGRGMLAFLLAFALTVLTVRVQRRGPEQVVFSNLCGPTQNDLCYRPVLKGGFPLAYLFDAPGVSVENQLAIGEDNLHAVPFAIDVAIWLAVVVLAGRAVARRRNRGASS
jgi:hypothetical protein